jgi:hypothetical protein
VILRLGFVAALVMATTPLASPRLSVPLSAGSSPAGEPPAAVATAPASVPDPPVDVVAVAGVASIRVSWQNPPMELGVANYVAYAEPAGPTCETLDWRSFGCVMEARAGVSYRVFVRSNGTSAPAYAPGRVTPSAAAGKPHGPPGSDSGPLPSTGERALAPLAVGVLLIVLGGAASLAGRGRLGGRR